MTRSHNIVLESAKASARMFGAIIAGVLALSSVDAVAELQAAPTTSEALAAVPASQASPPLSETLEIVVKFKDGKVKDITDVFWKDPQAAKARFDAFKQNCPEMASATLVRVTYSNELVLAYAFRTFTKAQRVAEARELAAKLMASPDVVYAEPNLSFQAQG